jgi:hypothetical protein
MTPPWSRALLLGAAVGALLAGCGANGPDTTGALTTPQSAAGSSSTGSSSSACPATPSPGGDDFCATVPLQPQAGGLSVGDIVAGSGATAQAGQRLTVQYTGWLAGSGQLFDSSRRSGVQPFSFVLGHGEVIKGWDQGLVGMHVGGKRRLVIPPALGYGAAGQGPIPPNATLVFDIELLSAAVPTPTPSPSAAATPTPTPHP